MSNPTTSIPKGSQIVSSNVLEAFHASKTGAFSDVKAKGQRIFDNDLYDIWQMNTYSVLIDVLGDNDVYTVYINDKARVNKYEKNTPMLWQCTCTWSDWAFNRITYHGRICSHVYCGYLLLREVKKMSKVANEEEPENTDLFPAQEFDSAESELIFNRIYDQVEDNFEAFFDFVTDDLATHDVSDTITEVMADYDLDHDEVEDVIKLCLMQVQDNIAMSTEDHIEDLESQVYREQLEELGIPMNDYDDLIDSELFDEHVEPVKASRRRSSSIKRAGRIFTEEEKIALIEEDGVSWHVLNNMFR